jgi:hypothetical protein
MMTELAIYQSEALAASSVSLPHRLGKHIDICSLMPTGSSYTLILTYCQQLWPDLNLVSDASLHEGTPLLKNQVCRSLTYVRKDGIRYGSVLNKRTKADQYAFISDGLTRIPVEISALLGIKIGDKSLHVCAIVRRMRTDDHMPLFPWDL